MEITININAPGLEKAINSLAGALNGPVITQNQPSVTSTTSTKVAEKDTKAVEKTTNAIEKDTKVEEKSTKATEEVKTESSGITLQNVKDVLIGFSRQGRQPELKEIISSFGAAKLSEVPEDKYAELIEKAEAVL